ncbi:MAG: dihydrodipicolinate synthase family protein [Proteobacteria bacterium]|nr:dihydrodipicolinate synthase family protein [Pseudomonadota bacterium]
MLTANTCGVFPVAVTPFHTDGRVDLESVDRLVDFYIERGAAGLTILGILGEAPKLEQTEAITLIRRFVRRAGTRSVIVGVSSTGFASMRALVDVAMDAGAAGVMIAPPSSLRTDEQIVGYYRQATDAIGPDVPVVVQDHPLAVQVIMSAQVIRRIVQELPSCVMLKHEDWPGLDKLATLRGFERDGSMRRISILCGNGGLFLDFELARGADGAMTGYAFPEMLVELYELHAAGRRDEAQDLFDLHLPLLRYEHQTGVGLAVRKYVLMRRGAIAFDAQRRPGSQLSPQTRKEVDYLLMRLGSKNPRFKV